jgi:pseudouridine-5'-phosphate glycosidase/pseudouridine kinase
VQEAVEQAVRESVEQGIDKRGKEVTPWLLKRVGELTTGSALELSEPHPIPIPPLIRDA